MQQGPVKTRACVICDGEVTSNSTAHRVCSTKCSNALRAWNEHMQSADRRNEIPVEPIRRIVLQHMAEHDLSLNELAYYLGWTCAGGTRGDTTRLQRRLGIKPNTSVKRLKDGSRQSYTSKLSRGINYDVAVKIIRALDVDPVDVPGGWL